VRKPEEAPPVSYLVKKIERFYFALHSTTTSLSFKLLTLRAYIYADVVRFTRCVLEGANGASISVCLVGKLRSSQFQDGSAEGTAVVSEMNELTMTDAEALPLGL